MVLEDGRRVSLTMVLLILPLAVVISVVEFIEKFRRAVRLAEWR